MASKKINKKKRRKITGILLGVLAAAAAVFMFTGLFKFRIFPMRMIIPAAIGILAVTAIFIFLQFTRINAAGNVLTVIAGVLFLTGALLLNGIYSKADKAQEKQKFTYSVLVLMEDDVKDMARTYAYFYGFNDTADGELTEKAMAEITKDVRLRPVFRGFSGLNSAIKALFDGDVKAVVFNEADRPVMEKLYPDFNKETRILKSYEFETDINAYPKAAQDSFSIYFSFNPEEGDNLPDQDADIDPKDEKDLFVSVNMRDKKAAVVEIPADCLIDFKTDAKGGSDMLSYLNVGDVNKIPATMKEMFGRDVSFYIKCFVPKDNIKSGIANIIFNDKIPYSSNLSPGAIASLLRAEIFDAGDWKVEYYTVTGNENEVTGQIYGAEDMTVTVPDKEKLGEIIKRLP